MSTIALFAFLMGTLIPLATSIKLLIWTLLCAALLLSLILLKRDEPTSLWNIACAVGFAIVARIAMIVVTSDLTWRGFHLGVEAENVMLKALVIMMLFLICGKMGHHWGYSLAGNAPTFSLMNLEHQRRLYTRIAIFGLIPIGVAVRFWLIAKHLGTPRVILTALANNSLDGRVLEGIGPIVLVANLAIAGVILLLFVAKNRRIWQFGVVMALLVTLVHVWSGRRSDILPILLAVVFSYHYKIRRIRFKHWILLAVVGYAVMSAILLGRLYFRGAYIQKISSDPLIFFVEELNLGIGGSIDGFLQTIAEEDGFGIRTWSYKPWYSFLWYPIPRALFPWKPEYTPIGKFIKGFYVAPSPDFDFSSGVAPTVLTTLYLNAGYIGVILGMIMLGISLGILDNQLLRRGASDGWMLHLIFWILVFNLLRIGDLTAAVTQIIARFGGLLAVIVAVNLSGWALKQQHWELFGTDLSNYPANSPPGS